MDGVKNIDDPDDDNDGVADLKELELGTNPFLKDTDRDKLSDYDEILVHGTSPLNADTDGDGLTDYYELEGSKTDPLIYDTDGGGAFDALEVVMHGDPNNPTDDKNFIDSDYDSLTDALEESLGTDPNDYDTDDGGAGDGLEYKANLDPVNDPEDDLMVLDSDHDGLMDYKEIELGADRFDSDSDDGGIYDGFEYYYNYSFGYDCDLLNASDDYWLKDNDGDGLLNREEYELGTNLSKPDTDDGGIDDGVEVRYGSDPLDRSDDREIDSDGDGLTDLEEKRYYTDPFKIDSDNDGLTDYYEISTSNTFPNNPDSDGDGLIDSLEINCGTDPMDVDSDNDGLNDWAEMQWLTDPNNADTDGDGIIDGMEVELIGDDYEIHSNPTLCDSDGDGLSDDIENDYNTDPLRIDSDGDGIIDWDEIYIFGTSPFDGTDSPNDNDGINLDRIRPDPELIRPKPDDPWYDPSIHDPSMNDPNTQPNLNAPSGNQDGGMTNILPLIIGLILIIIIVLYYISWRKQHIEEIAVVAERAEIRLTKIEDLEIDSIRAAIFDAYRSMLKIMQRYDFVRKKSMTPLEFEKVIATVLPISDKNISGLTRIFEEARYSDHKLNTQIRDRAIHCFRELKNELRGVHLGDLGVDYKGSLATTN